MNLDDLELELRRLPGVRSAGFTHGGDVLVVQVQVTGEEVTPNLPLQAIRIAYRHSDQPVALEFVRWRTAPALAAAAATTNAEPTAPRSGEKEGPAGDDAATASETTLAETAESAEGGSHQDREQRVRLLAVLTFPDTNELEVHLTYAGRRSIGRSTSSEVVAAAVEATLDGLSTFVEDSEWSLGWVRPLDNDGDDGFVVACGLVGPEATARFGAARGNSPIEAAARATLHALNRDLAPRLVPT